MGNAASSLSPQLVSTGLVAATEEPTAHADSPASSLRSPLPDAGTVLVFPAPTAGPKVPSPRPGALVPDAAYDLLYDMQQTQREHATGPKEKVSLYSFPSYLTTNIRRVLARNRTHRADWALALSCLLWQGLSRYSGLPAAQSLGDALLALDTDDGLHTLAGEQIEMWRRGFRFSISDPTHTMGLERCRSFKVPEHVHAELFDLATRLGLSGSTLGTVAVMAALESQEGVLGDHGDYMRATVAELDALLLERERRLRGLVRAIEAGVWR